MNREAPNDSWAELFDEDVSTPAIPPLNELVCISGWMQTCCFCIRIERSANKKRAKSIPPASPETETWLHQLDKDLPRGQASCVQLRCEEVGSTWQLLEKIAPGFHRGGQGHWVNLDAPVQAMLQIRNRATVKVGRIETLGAESLEQLSDQIIN